MLRSSSRAYSRNTCGDCAGKSGTIFRARAKISGQCLPFASCAHENSPAQLTSLGLQPTTGNEPSGERRGTSRAVHEGAADGWAQSPSRLPSCHRASDCGRRVDSWPLIPHTQAAEGDDTAAIELPQAPARGVQLGLNAVSVRGKNFSKLTRYDAYPGSASCKLAS